MFEKISLCFNSDAKYRIYVRRKKRVLKNLFSFENKGTKGHKSIILLICSMYHIFCIFYLISYILCALSIKY